MKVSLKISLQPPTREGNTAPLKFFGVASPVVIALGLLYVTRQLYPIPLHSLITQVQAAILGDL